LPGSASGPQNLTTQLAWHLTAHSVLQIAV